MNFVKVLDFVKKFKVVLDQAIPILELVVRMDINGDGHVGPPVGKSQNSGNDELKGGGSGFIEPR